MEEAVTGQSEAGRLAHLGWPFFEDAHRALERELGQLEADLTDWTLWGEGVWAGAIS